MNDFVKIQINRSQVEGQPVSRHSHHLPPFVCEETAKQKKKQTNKGVTYQTTRGAVADAPRLGAHAPAKDAVQQRDLGQNPVLHALGHQEGESSQVDRTLASGPIEAVFTLIWGGVT